ncbi:Protein of unknown function [Neorhodopirellula lusitana]|uniref:DUF805 domain-containing protein n=2 Tax=Neorhodopirellula lusitana TaxID=445327 RepID=A0ABY1PSM5_9BACT|nr:Protein of unknown function [Neorhodopirellula lusitana]
MHDSILRQPMRWFRVEGPVSRQEYLQLGFALGFLKYFVEVLVVGFLTGRFFTPLDFVNPWLNSKAEFLNDMPGAAVVWLLFTLPFVAVAVSMSIRRASDAGLSPWLGLAMLVPLVNLLFMSVLSIVPTYDPELEAELDLSSAAVTAAFTPPALQEDDDVAVPRYGDHGLSRTAAFMRGLGAGCAMQVFTGLVSVWVLQEYGFILFFTAPVVAGAISGAVFNRGYRWRKRSLFGLIALMNFVSFVLMLAVGLDGAICLLMAFPLLFPLSFFGGLAGRAIVGVMHKGRDDRRGMIGAAIMLPLCLLLEPLDDQRALHRVDTTVLIDAATPEVWQQVVAFPEITEQPAWFFRLGIAAPIRARIEGTGVGACRFCEFTTGAFVEPITTWQAPKDGSQLGLLAFDVTEQPLPMEEWTPFSGLHPPHLDDGFVSRRGQFLLEPIGNGKTRLTGTTWYDIDVRPRLYWKAWADPTIHAIHYRVLGHIQNVCEEPIESESRLGR